MKTLSKKKHKSFFVYLSNGFYNLLWKGSTVSNAGHAAITNYLKTKKYIYMKERWNISFH